MANAVSDQKVASVGCYRCSCIKLQRTRVAPYAADERAVLLNVTNIVAE
jgi:hypothetical protein